MNSTWLINSELANQRDRKVLFTCVVYTNNGYYQLIIIKISRFQAFLKHCSVNCLSSLYNSHHSPFPVTVFLEQRLKHNYSGTCNFFFFTKRLCSAISKYIFFSQIKVGENLRGFLIFKIFLLLARLSNATKVSECTIHLFLSNQ